MIPLHPLAAVVRSICDRNREFYSDRRGIGALKDLQQTFPNPWLYVAELVQNAIDAGATRIASTPGADGTLVFEHDGAPFTESDVESLCMRGVSSKGAGTVGFMGIGFKSVFRSFQRVEIASAEWRFALTVDVRAGVRFGDNQRDWLGAVLPEWDDAVEPPSEGMTCRFRLSRRLAELPATEEDLDRVLGSDSSLLALLAWQGVIELGWNGQQWVLERREFPIGAGADQRVELTSIDGDGITLRRWVLFSTKYQPSDRAIARFLEHRQLTPPPEDQPRVYEEASRARRVAVFCEIDQDGDPQTVERGSAFALLPTGVSFPLGLHVQADWLLVVSRRELMQIEGNEWHEEILRQLPQLLRNFLLWLVDTPWPDGSVRHRGYDALPGESSGDREPDQWFEGEEFREAMSVCLADLPFLPVPPEEGGPVTFITPRQGCRLPQPLATHFKDDDVSHRVLFGNHTFSSALLGDRALRYLVELQLLTYLSAEQLAAEWENGVVASWYTRLDEGRRDQALGGLLNALAELDHDEKWRGAKLLCLPTEAGGWTVRGDAVRYPSDWAVLAQEGDIRDALEPLVGAPERTVRWSFDRAVYQPRSTGAKYLEPLVPSKLESLADRWWASLPSHPDAEQVRVVLRFTSWVRAKQPNRKNLVRKLLAMDPAGQMSLRPTQEVLVAAPYADDCRKTWFTGLPVISADYAGQDSQATPGDWRTFFESLVPAPQGRFTLRLTTGDHDSASLKSLVGDDYLPPSLRASYKQVAWRGLTVDSTHYKVLDAELPLLLSEKLASHAGMTPEDSRSLVTWISESPNMLREYSARKIAYIAYGEGTVTERPLDIDSSWKRDLQERSWAFTVANTGPYPPREVLAEPDPARPDAPVAALPPDFLRLLREVGIDFGSDIPDAPHVLRLRVQGPSAPVEELLRLAKAAATEARSDAGKREYLKETLLATNLFPLPSGRVSPDRLSRVSLDRVVRTERGRSTFGSWLAVADPDASNPIGRRTRRSDS